MARCGAVRYPLGVRTRCLDPKTLCWRLKLLIVNLLRVDILDPDTIADSEPLRGGRLGFDDLDRLELAIGIEEAFGVAVRGRLDSSVCASIAGLAELIGDRVRSRPTRAANSNRWGRWRAATKALRPSAQPKFAPGAMLSF
jgi:acyl carrier protein